MLDNMVVSLSNGDVDISMLTQAVELIDGRFETEVLMFDCIISLLTPYKSVVSIHCKTEFEIEG